MYSLLIDTHDTEINLGIYKDTKLVDSRSKKSTMHHSDYIMPLLKEMLDDNSITVHDLGEILCVNGPGSFTGVRLGVTIAKTLAYTLQIPIKTITSLEMYAVSANSDDDKLVIIKDMKGCFGALFTSTNEIKEDYFYKSNSEFEEYITNNNLEDKIVENTIDFNKVFELFTKKETTIAHKVNPVYIKVIEALK